MLGRFVDSDFAVLDSIESIIIDGANGVTGAPRQHFAHAAEALAVMGVVLVATLLFQRRAVARWLLPVLLVIAALPGVFEVLIERADAPLRRPHLASTIQTTLGELDRHARWPGPVRVTREDDLLFPLGRYVVPTRPTFGTPALDLELRGDRVEVTCRTEAARIVCGAAP